MQRRYFADQRLDPRRPGQSARTGSRGFGRPWKDNPCDLRRRRFPIDSLGRANPEAVVFAKSANSRGRIAPMTVSMVAVGRRIFRRAPKQCPTPDHGRAAEPLKRRRAQKKCNTGDQPFRARAERLLLVPAPFGVRRQSKTSELRGFPVSAGSTHLSGWYGSDAALDSSWLKPKRRRYGARGIRHRQSPTHRLVTRSRRPDPGHCPAGALQNDQAAIPAKFASIRWY